MTPETGAGLPNSDSYASLAQADGYALAAGWADWASATIAAKESALVGATRYIDASYRFKGELLLLTQALAWPRNGVIDYEGRPLTGVPKSVMGACCELARASLGGKVLTPAPESAAIKRKKVKAGSVETETEYAVAGGSSADASPSVMADRLLAGLLANGNVTSMGSGFVSFIPA